MSAAGRRSVLVSVLHGALLETKKPFLRAWSPTSNPLQGRETEIVMGARGIPVFHHIPCHFLHGYTAASHEGAVRQDAAGLHSRGLAGRCVTARGPSVRRVASVTFSPNRIEMRGAVAERESSRPCASLALVYVGLDISALGGAHPATLSRGERRSAPACLARSSGGGLTSCTTCSTSAAPSPWHQRDTTRGFSRPIKRLRRSVGIPGDRGCEHDE